MAWLLVGLFTAFATLEHVFFAFKNGAAEHINSFELGQHGRYRTNVWQYRGMNSMAAGLQCSAGVLTVAGLISARTGARSSF